MMQRRRSGLWLPLVLLALCTALIGVIYRELTANAAAAASTPAAIESAKAVSELPGQLHFAQRPFKSFEAVLERPIFSPSRRPATREEPQVYSEISFELKGILVDDDYRVALFQLDGQAKLMRATLGESIEGWRLTEIETDRVVMEQGGTERIVEPTLTPRGTPRASARGEKSLRTPSLQADQDESSDAAGSDGQDSSQ